MILKIYFIGDPLTHKEVEMESTMIIAKILGPMFLIIGVGITGNMKYYQRVMEDFIKNAALMYVGGVMALLFGFIILSFHNTWRPNLSVIITIIGWLSLIKGVVLIVAPNAMARIADSYRAKTPLMIVHMILVFVIGILLSIVGYLG